MKITKENSNKKQMRKPGTSLILMIFLYYREMVTEDDEFN
jgi:hypothetical protein